MNNTQIYAVALDLTTFYIKKWQESVQNSFRKDDCGLFCPLFPPVLMKEVRHGRKFPAVRTDHI